MHIGFWWVHLKEREYLEYSDVDRRRIQTFLFLSGANSPTRAKAALFLRSLDRTQEHTTAGSTPLSGFSRRSPQHKVS